MDRKKIANTLETYFSDANLMWDKTMQLLINNDSGCVPFERLIKLQRIKALNIDALQLKDAALEYSMKRLKISEDGNSIGRIKPFVFKKTQELDDWSIYVEGLGKRYQTEQQITELFQKHIGRVSFVRIPKNRVGIVQFYGFCFVEFDDKANVQRAVELMNAENDQEIKKLGLKVMSKNTWNQYQDEYLAHMKNATQHIAQLWKETNESAHRPTHTKSNPIVPTSQNSINTATKQQHQDSAMAYPKNVIVFVQNLHPKSSKTTIKKILEQSGATTAFVKHKKGLDSCHVRMSSPEDTEKVTQYFETHHLFQASGTDSQGSTTNASLSISVRPITGKEEEIYWNDDPKRGELAA